jgi:N-acetylneuraminic acid mutarotase
MGIQQSAVSLLGNYLVSAGGATRYPKDVVKHYPGVFGGASQGCTSYTFALDVRQDAGHWTRIADMPGPCRETGMAVTIDDTMYVVGGFSHSEPYAFRDGYRLRRRGPEWVWDKLPVELPWPIAEAGIAVIGRRIYLVGGADFYAEAGAKPDFFTDRSRTGEPVGTSLLVLDTADLGSGWRQLAPLPGTSRFDQALAAVGNRLYSLGGINRGRDVQPMLYRNLVDCWQYEVDRDTWSRLPDSPAFANASAVGWQHYVIVLGGFRYGETLLLDGRRLEIYTAEEKKLEGEKNYGSFVQRSVFVFDIRNHSWGRADVLPEQASLPMTAVSGDRIFVLGGEGGRLWHSDTLQIGAIEERARR